MRLVAENLCGERGGDRLFSGIAFVLDPGDALLVTGPNGSGKSTLLRILSGLLPAAEGRIALEGGGEAWPSVASACHYLGHQNAMKPALSVGENLSFWRSFQGEPRLDVEEALDRVGLAGIRHLPFGYLSAGQRRRAAVARLLMSFRPVWLLDEPTTALDRASEAEFAAMMRAHRSEDGIIIAATHQALGLEEAGELRLGGPTSHG